MAQVPTIPGRNLFTQSPGESPGSPIWSSLQLTCSIMDCGDSFDKMADILSPQSSLPIEFRPLWCAVPI